MSIKETKTPLPEPGDFCIDDPEALCDDHGTAVTGVIAARANNDIGIVGFCAQCTVIPIRLIGEYIAPLSADIEAFRACDCSGRVGNQQLLGLCRSDTRV